MWIANHVHFVHDYNSQRAQSFILLQQTIQQTVGFFDRAHRDVNRNKAPGWGVAAHVPLYSHPCLLVKTLREKKQRRKPVNGDYGLTESKLERDSNPGAVLYQLKQQANWELATLCAGNIPEDEVECKRIY